MARQVSAQQFGRVRCESVFVSPALVENELGPLPRTASLRLERAHVDAYFARARNIFLESYGDGSDLRQTLRTLAKGQKISSEVFARMKALRKLAITVRSGFIVFDEKHKVPKRFERFAKAFGKLNDALEFDADRLVPDLADRLLDAAGRQDISRDLESFEAASPKSVERRMSELREEILTLAKERTMSVHDFHEVRKLLKHVLVSVQMAQAIEPSTEKKLTFDYLTVLNDALGNLRQGALEADLQSREQGEKPPNDEEVRQELPANLHRSIIDALRRLAMVRPAKNGREELALTTHLRFNPAGPRGKCCGRGKVTRLKFFASILTRKRRRKSTKSKRRSSGTTRGRGEPRASSPKTPVQRISSRLLHLPRP